MNSLLQMIGAFGRILQEQLFPALQEELGPMSEMHQQFVRALALLQMDSFVSLRHGRGRPGHDRASIARALLAKAVFNFPTTRALLDRLHVDACLRRLCGYEAVAQIPDESVFSRAFAEFAEAEFAQRVHAALIQRTHGEQLVGHIMRDSTAIESREKALPKAPSGQPKARRVHRKGGGKKRPEQMTRVERQCSGEWSLEQMLAELPRHCDYGCKTNSQGRKFSWRGYKLHVDVADGQIPITCVLTAASLHDSQAAVPLARRSAQLVTSLYDLMDSGYDSELIRENSRGLGHVPIIPRQKKGHGEQPTLDPHQLVRLRERSAIERVFARLKEEFGGATVRVRGWAKVMTHLMFGILALSADQTLRRCSIPGAQASPAPA